MTEQPPPESIPYEVLIDQLQRMLAEQTRQLVLANARIAVRDQTIEHQNGQIASLSDQLKREYLSRTIPGSGEPPLQQAAHQHVNGQGSLDQPGQTTAGQ